MADILPFKAPAKKAKRRRSSLCDSGFHRWLFDHNKQFDVRQGKLVSIRRCQRCGKSETVLS